MTGVIIVNYRTQGRTYEEALAKAVEHEWCNDITDEPQKVTYLFPWMRESRFNGARFLGMIPEISEETFNHVFTGFNQRYIGSTALVATTTSFEKLAEYMASMMWFVEGFIDILGYSFPMSIRDIPTALYNTV